MRPHGNWGRRLLSEETGGHRRCLEPTLALAPLVLETLSRALARLRATIPISVLLGEQKVTFALPHADRVYVLDHARIVWEGPPDRFEEEASAGYL